MAVGVNIQSYDANRDLEEISRDAQFLQLSNHSYGDQATGWRAVDFGDGLGPVDVWFAESFTLATIESDRFGRYNRTPQILDDILFNNPNLLSIWAAANERDDRFGQAGRQDGLFRVIQVDPNDPNRTQILGYSRDIFGLPPSDGNGGTGFDTLTPSGGQTAKNTLVVGAIEDITFDPFGPNDAVSASFSSWGPTDDGRMKPDVVGNGVDVFSTYSGSDFAYESIGGTSMATPNVTGTAALLYEHFNNLYGFFPRSSTGKGIIIHTAKDVGNIGPDYAFGWGVVDGVNAAEFITSARQSSDNPTGSAPNLLLEGTYSGAVQEFAIESDGQGPIKATIVWTDPAPANIPLSGLDNPAPVLVNNLDLVIVGPDGTVYNPWTLSKDNPAAPAVRTQANNLDNVEQVLIDAPTAGTYTIQVGNRSGLAFTQDYSLLISSDPSVVGPPDQDEVPFLPTPEPIIEPNAYDISIAGTTFSGSFPTENFALAGELVVGPGIGSINFNNGFNPVDVGISAGTPILGPGGSLAFATNTLLLPFIGVDAINGGQPPLDNSFVEFDQASRTLRVTIDPNSASTIGVPSLNSFITQTSFLSAPKSILGGELLLQFSADNSTVSGTVNLVGETSGSFFAGGSFFYQGTIFGSQSGFSTFG